MTGASGFIGFHLIEKLVAEGNEVLGIDNFNSYYSPELKMLRKQQLSERFNVEVLNLDICNKDSIKKVIYDFQPNSIIHLAAQPGIRLPLSKSENYINNNIVGFTNVLEVAVQREVPNFLYASSSRVYGNSTQIPFSEKQVGIRPISIYGTTKLCNEILTTSYISNSKTRARGMRFFTVYGAWGRPDMAYLRLAACALTGNTFKLFGDGTVKRDFTYVGDIATMINSLDKELATREEGFDDVVNIGGGNPHSMNDLIRGIENITGKQITISFEQRDKSDTNLTYASTELLRELTGFSPKVNLEEGLAQVIEWATRTEIVEKLINWTESTI